jgi:uncharacterized protein YuzE
MEPKKIKNLSPSISYDKKSDVVYISFGKSRPGIASEIDDGDFIRVDPYTNEIVGITLLYFSERYLVPTNKNIRKSIKDILPCILDKYYRLPKHSQK